MSDSTLPDPNPDPALPAIPTIPVVCDRCRAEGVAGNPAFSAIPDLLNFEPVQRRAHVSGWRPEHQRAFIAALAITGSPRQAARAIGRHAFGAEQLRTARGGRAFAAAWDAALELARDRELAGMHANLARLAEERQSGSASAPAGQPGPYVRQFYGEDYDPDDYLEGHAEYVEGMGNVRDKLLRARRLYLSELVDNPRAREAWEVLAGPVDWDKARRLEAQDNEPLQQRDADAPSIPNLRQPDMLLTAEAGWLGDIVGGPNKMDALRDAIAELNAEQSAEAKPIAAQQHIGLAEEPRRLSADGSAEPDPSEAKLTVGHLTDSFRDPSSPPASEPEPEQQPPPPPSGPRLRRL